MNREEFDTIRTEAYRIYEETIKKANEICKLSNNGSKEDFDKAWKGAHRVYKETLGKAQIEYNKWFEENR